MTLVRPEPALGKVHVWPPDRLSLDLKVVLTRRKRGTCPVCLRRRVLFAIDAFSPSQPVGFGVAMCLECGGLRQPRAAK